MHLIEFSQIEVAGRQRKEIVGSPLKELKESIRENGLLHPIVVMKQPKSSALPYRLIAGGRRLAAIRELYDEFGSVKQANYEVSKPKIYANILEEADIARQLTLEYEENVIRLDLPWQDQQQAIAAIHEAMKESNPKQSQTDTALQIQAAAGGESALSLSHARKKVAQSLAVVEHLHRPDIQKAKSANEAYQIILKESSDKFTAELARRRLKQARAAERLWDLKHGDLRHVLPELEDGQVDLILTDPPYGLGSDKNKADSARNFHRYEDSESYALELSIFIIQEGWRLTKPKANLFMFCTWKTFPTLFEAAAKYGWSPWYHPIVWHKSNEGEAPWGRLGFTRTYEIFLYATKGQKGINGPLPDVLNFQKLGTKGRDHAAEKPQSLLTKLVEVGTLPHDLVLDPCAGSGSTLEAAIRASRRAKGCELDEGYFNSAMSRLSAIDEERAQKAADSISPAVELPLIEGLA